MSTEKHDQSTARTAGCAAVLCSLTIYPKLTNTMTLTQLKKRVDAAYEYAIDCLQSPDSIPVTLQLNRDGDEGDAICTHEDVEVHYDNNACATGCVICATLSENTQLSDAQRSEQRHGSS